jgi:hypothetical protein
MLFSLEILQAHHGDCLLLHFGPKNNPQLMVIDGGPSDVYESFLKPRLLAIKENRQLEKALPISMIMVSHLDDDHAKGICDMTDEMVSDGNESPFKVTHLWVNTFDDILGNNQLPATASLAASAGAADIASLGLPGIEKLPEDEVAVIASTSQGRLLRDNAKTLSLAVNKPFTKLPGSSAILVRGDSPDSEVPLSGLTITVVSPDQERLVKLQKQWDKDLKKFKEKGDKSIITAAVASPDTSPFNLSSIACLVEVGGKKILLTGDGRSDFILEGLEKNKLLNKNKKLHVDIIKWPHHGSIRNMTKAFLQNVTADHYVISADGRDDNPDKPTLDLLADTVAKGTIHFTNRDGKNDLKKKMDAFEKKLVKNNSKLTVKFLAPEKTSMLIELGEKISF